MMRCAAQRMRSCRSWGHSALVVFGRGSRCVLCGSCCFPTVKLANHGQINKAYGWGAPAVLVGTVSRQPSPGGHEGSICCETCTGLCGNGSGPFSTPAVFKLLGVSYELACVWGRVSSKGWWHLLLHACVCLCTVYGWGRLVNLPFLEGLVVCVSRACMWKRTVRSCLHPFAGPTCAQLMQPLNVCGAASSHSLYARCSMLSVTAQDICLVLL